MKIKYFFVIFIFFIINISCSVDNKNVKYSIIQNYFENEKILIKLDILSDNDILEEFKFPISENPYIYRQNTFSKENVYFNVFRLMMKCKSNELNIRFTDIQIKDINNNYAGIFYDKEKLIKLFESELNRLDLIEKYKINLDKTYIVDKRIYLSKNKSLIYYFIIVSDQKLYLSKVDFKVLIKFILDDIPQSYVFYFKSEAPKEEEKKEESW